MNITRKRLKELRQSIIELREWQSKTNNSIERRLADLSREIFDILEPPKKGYTRFKTIDGWVSFKLRKKSKSLFKAEAKGGKG